MAQPAEALRLLIEHQHDRTEQPNESTEPAEPAATYEDGARFEDEPGCEPDSNLETDDHRSLSMAVPPAFDATAARPRVVLRFHLPRPLCVRVTRWSDPETATR